MGSVSRKTEFDLDQDYPQKEPHLHLDLLQLKIISREQLTLQVSGAGM